MCKIAGIFAFDKIKNRTLVYNLVRKMMLQMESGGPHASGIALIDTDLDLHWYYKIGKPAHEFVDLPQLKKAILGMSYNLVLIHTRYATHGPASDNINNHPFCKNNNFLIHNGVIHDYQRINNKFEVTNESECDSETILSVYNKQRNIKDIIAELSGHNAFALYDSKIKQMYIYGSGYDVEIMYNKTRDLFIFNTIPDVIYQAFGNRETLYRYFSVTRQADELYPMNRQEQELVTVDFINEKFKKEIVKDKEFIYDEKEFNKND
jgi:predicted glutamine amidotransferase